MKAYILAGGYGTRFAEKTDNVPKPMIEIGKWPILIHIMSHYSSFQIKDFTILAGYKAQVIEDYFLYGNGVRLCKTNSWKVEVIDTGKDASTAGRLWAVRESLPDKFMLTYGDGLSDIDVSKLLKSHIDSNLTATVTAVRPPARFGTIDFSSGIVTSFKEKDSQRTGWINGGFFCFNRAIVDFIQDPSYSLESLVMESLVRERQLGVFPFEGFWHPMDTLRDHRFLSKIYQDRQFRWNTEALE